MPHGNLVCKIPLIWRMLTRMTRSHCAGAAGGGQSCDPSLGAALCLHFLQTETHHSPPSPPSVPHPPKYNPSKQQHPSIHPLSPKTYTSSIPSPAPLRKIIHKGKSQTQSQKGCILHTNLILKDLVTTRSPIGGLTYHIYW